MDVHLKGANHIKKKQSRFRLNEVDRRGGGHERVLRDGRPEETGKEAGDGQERRIQNGGPD